MKNKLFSFQTLVAVMLSVVMSISFTSCSDDDDKEPSQENLESVIIGTWTWVHRDGDKYPVTLKISSASNGIINGVDLEDNIPFKWTKNGDYYICIEDGVSAARMFPIKVTKDKIEWKFYGMENNYDGEGLGSSWVGFDDLGYYQINTWTRVK